MDLLLRLCITTLDGRYRDAAAARDEQLLLAGREWCKTKCNDGKRTKKMNVRESGQKKK
jgi:hypothetical protein